MSTAVAEGESHLFCWEVQLGYHANLATHAHPFHEIFYCISGHGEQFSAAGNFLMSPGDFFFFPAGQPHVARSDSTINCTGVVLYMSDNFFIPLREGEMEFAAICSSLSKLARTGENRIILSPAGRNRTGVLMISLADEFRNKVPGYRCATQTLLQDLLLTLLRDPQAPKELLKAAIPIKNQHRLYEVTVFLHANYMSDISIEQLLEIAHMSRSQFHAIFKAETGETVISYLNRLRLNAAEDMLHESTLSITTIANQCGFNCLSHFYHLFHTRYGVTPKVMRQNAKGRGIRK